MEKEIRNSSFIERNLKENKDNLEQEKMRQKTKKRQEKRHGHI